MTINDDLILLNNSKYGTIKRQNQVLQYQKILAWGKI